jgi:hypothetical protein
VLRCCCELCGVHLLKAKFSLSQEQVPLLGSMEVLSMMPSSGMLHRVVLQRTESCVLQLLVTAKIVPSSPILVTLTMEEIRSPETSVLKEPHGATSQKTAFYIDTDVKTSNIINSFEIPFLIS